QRFEREQQRALHQSVDQQAVLIGINIGGAGMAALEVQPIRRDHAVEQLQRRPHRADTHGRRIGRCCNDPRHLALETRGLAVADERRARLRRPRGHRERLGRRGRRSSGAGQQRAFEKNASVQQPIAGGVLLPPAFPFPAHRFAPLLSLCYSARLPFGMIAASKFAPASWASVRIAFSRLAPSRLLPRKSAPLSLAPNRLTPARSAPCRSAPLRSASTMSPMLKSMPARSMPRRFWLSSLAARRSAPLSLAPASRAPRKSVRASLAPSRLA